MCFPPSVKIIFNYLMSNFLIMHFFYLSVNWLCVENFMMFSTLKKHIAFISMMGHFCIYIKVSSLHNLMKKQWLIPLNSTLFCCDWICIWMTFWIYIVISMLLKNPIIFSFWFCSSYFLWKCLCNYFAFSSICEDYF